MATNNKIPAMYDLDSYIQAGINPQTGLPFKAEDNGISCVSKADIKKQLRIMDEQDAVNRFTWYNLPSGLNSRLMERILYYKGQAMFFKINDTFYFLPYALAGSIDVYGRFTEVTPLPFNGSTKAKDGKERPWIPGLKRKVAHDVQMPDGYVSEESELAGVNAAHYIEDKFEKSKKDPVYIKAGEGISYTLPQYINPDTMQDEAIIRFRVNNIYQKRALKLLVDGKEVAKKRKLVYAPGEMENMILKKEDLPEDVKTIEVRLEEI